MIFDRAIELGVTDMTYKYCVLHVIGELRTPPDVINISMTLAKGETFKVLMYTNAGIPNAAFKEAVDETGGYEIESIVC